MSLFKQYCHTISVRFSVVVVPVPQHDDVQAYPASQQEGFHDIQAPHEGHPEPSWTHLIASCCFALQAADNSISDTRTTGQVCQSQWVARYCKGMKTRARHLVCNTREGVTSAYASSVWHTRNGGSSYDSCECWYPPPHEELRIVSASKVVAVHLLRKHFVVGNPGQVLGSPKTLQVSIPAISDIVDLHAHIGQT